MLIIQPIGGLCNRIRAINSASMLAAERKEPLKVIWNINEELGCPFEELFQKPAGFSVVNISSKWNLQKLFYQFTRHRIGNEEIRANRTPDGFLSEDFRRSLPKNLFIATEEHFYPCHDYSSYIPTKGLQEAISRLTSQFGAHNVGIHIRRTDNKPAIGKSSTQAFVESMEKELDVHPGCMFYLATDDMTEEYHLRQIFPDHILSNQSRDLSRNSIAGIRDALIDLFCLSKTDKIIGSYFSSFTDMAADMNGIEKIIAGEL